MANGIRNRILKGFPGIALPSYEIDIAKGIVEGRVAASGHGHNLAAAAGEETIWTASTLYSYLTSAEQLKVSSSVAATDVSASTGAWTILIEGLNANYRPISETVTLLNPGPVTTILSFLRVFHAHVMTAGTGGKNAGIISVKNNANAITLGHIAVGENESHMAIYTVPVGLRYILLEWCGGELAAKESHILLYIREYEALWQLKEEVVLKDNNFIFPQTMPLIVSERSDIELRCTASGGAGIIFGGFSGYTEENKY